MTLDILGFSIFAVFEFQCTSEISAVGLSSFKMHQGLFRSVVSELLCQTSAWTCHWYSSRGATLILHGSSSRRSFGVCWDFKAEHLPSIHALYISLQQFFFFLLIDFLEKNSTKTSQWVFYPNICAFSCAEIVQYYIVSNEFKGITRRNMNICQYVSWDQSQIWNPDISEAQFITILCKIITLWHCKCK